MRIDQLNIKNFKCFEDQTLVFHPQFNLIVGVNGVGKTSVLDALSVALGSWFLGVIAFDTRQIKQSEVRLAGYSQKIVNRPQDSVFYAQPQYPVTVHAMGEVQGQNIEWQRSLNTPKGRTTYVSARSIKEIATEVDHLVSDGKDILLPLISYYGTGRLWDTPRDQAQVRSKDIAYKTKNSLSRFRGYKNSVDPRLSPSDLVYWIAEQSWIAYQQGDTPVLIQVVKNAILGCIEGAKNIFFDPRYGEVIIEFENQTTQPFNNLSDGQRCMFAMIGDIAQKAAVLNPQLGDKVLEETSGVVLIDELDLHLHPKWQRRIIDDLKTTFPKVQFICTTHSPQLIGQAKPEEIIILDQETTHHPAQSYGMDSNWILRHVMGGQDRDPVIAAKLDEVFEDIEENEFDIAETKINDLRQEIGEHPELVEAAALISRYSRFETDSMEDE